MGNSILRVQTYESHLVGNTSTMKPETHSDGTVQRRLCPSKLHAQSNLQPHWKLCRSRCRVFGDPEVDPNPFCGLLSTKRLVSFRKEMDGASECYYSFIFKALYSQTLDE